MAADQFLEIVDVSIAPRPIMSKHSVNKGRKYAATDETNYDTNVNSVKNRGQAKKSAA